MLNHFKRRRIIKQQVKAEYYDRKEVWGHKRRDSLKSYLQVRRELITQQLKLRNVIVNEKEIEQLAKNTRGLIKEDIDKSVDEYIESGKIPQALQHPTNTCDPYTGNWMEHLFNPYIIKKVLVEGGFEARILNGYYGFYLSPLKKLAVNFMNISISLLKKEGIGLAPFYIIYGKK